MKFKAFIVAVFLVYSLLPGVSHAQNKVVVIPLMETGPPAPVPKTGQTSSYASGDDGDHEAGIAWPNPRCLDNGNGTVMDKLTGMMWLKNVACGKFYQLDLGGANRRSWVHAINSCDKLSSGFCGLSDDSNRGDWRLPNVNDLKSLVHHGRYDPALPPDCPLVGLTPLPLYWSATTYEYNPNYAWGVSFKTGPDFAKDKITDYYVWCVRDGP